MPWDSSIACHARRSMSVTSGASDRYRTPGASVLHPGHPSISPTLPASAMQPFADAVLLPKRMRLSEAASWEVNELANVARGDAYTILSLKPATATVVRIACLKTLRRTSWDGTTTRHLWPATPKELASALQTPAEVPTTMLMASAPAACKLVSIFTAISTSPWSTTVRTIALLSLRFVMSETIWCSLFTCCGQSKSKKLGFRVSQLNALKRLAIGASPALSAKHCSSRCCSLFTLKVDS
mmetsp:Transcript_17787/g.47056  ORF Transcript_17787/g.47056 Transcript_17787/m.47056 type:complete len:240 (-) Transcript_17787:40-759(-)